jgi:hypothetical protein
MQGGRGGCDSPGQRSAALHWGMPAPAPGHLKSEYQHTGSVQIQGAWCWGQGGELGTCRGGTSVTSWVLLHQGLEDLWDLV